MAVRYANGDSVLDLDGISLTLPQLQSILGGDDDLGDVIGRFLTGGDTIVGGQAGDVITGLAGDDELTGGGGNDTLIGGAGADTASFAGGRAAYSVTKVGAEWRIAANTGTEGTDVLREIETLRFADALLPLVEPAAPAGTPVPAYGANNGLLFDPVYYLLNNSDLISTVTADNALQHYFATGANQDREPNVWFDAGYYANRWADLTALNLNDATLFMHYNLYGVWEGRSAGPKFDQFDGNRYLAENPDVAAYVDAHLPDFLGSRSNGAIAHYVIYGSNEQRVAYDAGGGAIDLGYSA